MDLPRTVKRADMVDALASLLPGFIPAQVFAVAVGHPEPAMDGAMDARVTFQPTFIDVHFYRLKDGKPYIVDGETPAVDMIRVKVT
jgi:hypothetical protein